GIVHYDIEPDNILLVPRNDHGFVAKLEDFRLAKNMFFEVESPYLRGSCPYMTSEL
ncbi:hypothetical protein Dsin_029281, partial [Dipteronia sinensis]